MDNIKTNDMLLATMSNPEAQVLDFLGNDVRPDNTQLLAKDDYKSKDYIKEQFTTEDGKFDEQTFDMAYNMALSNYNQIANEKAMENLDDVEYEMYDWTRPITSKVRSVDIKYNKDYNQFWNLYNRDHMGSVTQSDLSLREIAQKGRVYDAEKNTWSQTSANDFGLLDKFFGDTLVYAQWDEDGVHNDLESGRTINHKKGDWKVDEYGQLYLEKLGNREVYGKQVVNPTDILTTDGSIFNKFDFLDSDGRKKSIGKIAVKTIVEIAPLLIPGFNTYYGGTKAALSLAAVMPTFYKSLEGMLLGDSKQYGNDPINKAEGWMAKFSAQSTSDKGSEGLFNVEQMSDMVTSIFSQIHEQRAIAAMSKYLVRPGKLLDGKAAAMQAQLVQKIRASKYATGIDTSKAYERALKSLPELQKAIEKQSQLSKGLSLGYMALTSTSQIYGEALEGGFDRRSAGFASLLAAGGQYGIMMNNRMGDWFLDKSTGYTVETNKALMAQSIKPWLKEINDIFTNSKLSIAGKKQGLASITNKFYKGMHSFFTEPSVIGEAMLKNAAIEGVEEVTEQVVEDMSKGVLDVMSYLGLTSKKGSFDTVESYKSGEAFQEYLANFVGGVLGGGLFEAEARFISPMIRGKGKLPARVTQSIYDLVANGHKEELIKIIKREAPKLTNNYLSYTQNGDALARSDENADIDYKTADGASQTDLVSNAAIDMIEHLEGVLGSEGLMLTDEQIMNKAIKSELIIDAFEKVKQEGKHVGIEGMLLEDFKRTASQIVESVEEIKAFESAPDKEKNKGSIDLAREKLTQKRAEIKEILNGERNMTYFNRMAAYLNPQIREIFGSLDRYNYIKSKYNLDYNTLEDTGTDGLTKEKADLDWDGFLESTDILGKLEHITNGYLDMEAFLNPAIDQTVSSGYYDIRKESHKTYLNLKEAIKTFNTAGTDAERQRAMQNFININKYIESNGWGKVLPWDSFRTNLADTIFDEDLVMKRSLDEEGEEIFIPYEEGELDTKLANGNTLKENIKMSFNNVVGTLPTNPLNMDLVIAQYNSHVNHANLSIDAQIQEVQNSALSAEEKQDKLDILEQQKITNVIRPVAESKSQREFERINKANFELEVQQVDREHRREIDLYIKAIKVASLYKNEEGKFIDFASIVDENGGTDGDWTTLDNSGKIAVLNELATSGILEQVVTETEKTFSDVRDNVDKYLADLQARITPEEGSVQGLEPINTDFESTFFGLIKTNIESITGILVNEDIKTKVETITNLEKDYQERLMNERPNIFKMHNYAFDFMVQTLKNGHYDNEIYLEAKEMYEEELRSIAKQIFPEAKHLSLETIDKILALEGIEIIDYLDTFLEEEDLSPATKYMDFEPSMESMDDSEIGNLLRTLLKDNFSPATTLRTISMNLARMSDNIAKNSQMIESLREFSTLDSSKMVANPLFDMLRTFSMQMNSNPNASINKIFDLLGREIDGYKSASTADNFLSSGVRVQDIEQAINTLEMFSSVVNAMSTTELFGDDFNGFIAMRQRFAKMNGITDPVEDLKTITSDQAAVMMLDLQHLKNKLTFIKDLGEHNSKRHIVAHAEIGDQADIVHIEMFRDLDGVQNVTPANFKDILTDQDLSNKERIAKLETAFYDHNKNDKEGAFERILKFHLTNVDSEGTSTYTKETTNSTLPGYNKAIYFATNLQLRTDDYLKRQKKVLEGPFDKASFYLQEYTSKIITATIENPNLFSKIFDIKQNLSKQLADTITLILGGAGTGKSTVTVAGAIDQIRQTNDNSNIWLAGPTMDQAVKLQEDIVKAIGDKNLNLTVLDRSKLFSMFGDKIKAVHEQIMQELNDVENESNTIIKIDGNHFKFVSDPTWVDSVDFTTLPNLLVFDEVTHLSQPEILLLQMISKASLNNGSGNFFKVTGTGDPSQMGYQVKYRNQYIEWNVVGLNAIHTPYLTTSVRASNDQKRLNSDMSLGLVTKATDIYEKASADENFVDYKGADSQLTSFLTDVANETNLRYHMGEKGLSGDYIAESYRDLSVLTSIKQAIELAELEGEKPLKIGVLGQTTALTQEMKAAFLNAGITEDMIEKHVEVKTPKNVQGSEFDYFIFDMEVMPEYNKLQDVLKAFYTYSLRSRNGTVIYDLKDSLRIKLNIANAKMSDRSTDFELLGPEDVKKMKADRIAEIDKIVGTDPISKESNFKWISGLLSQSEKLDKRHDEGRTELEKLLDLFQSVKIPTEAPVIKEGTGNGEGAERPKVLRKIEDFGVEVHAFYNNPNARVTYDEDGKPKSLETHANKVRMDLNGVDDITNPELLQKVIAEWSSLRYDLFRNGSKEIGAAKYKDFFTHVFGANDKAVKIDYLVTASLFRKEINSPIKKQGFDADKVYENGDVFRNVTARLTIGTGKNAKVHYITLATLSANDTFSNKGLEYLDATAEDKAKIVNDVLAADVKIKRLLETSQADSNENFLVTGQLGPNDLEIISSTRLIGKQETSVTHTIDSLQYNFPGMKVSEIRIFPSNYKQFKNVVEKYTYGEPREEGVILQLYSGQDKDGITKHSRLAGKPYVVVSFGDDLDGKTGKTTSARFIPIFAESRDITTVRNEINTIRREIQNILDDHYEGIRAGATNKFLMPAHINAQNETLLDKSQILDVLIKWENTPFSYEIDGEHKTGTLLDVLIEEVDIKNVGKKSLVHLMDNFRETESGTLSTSGESFIKVLEKVKLHGKKTGLENAKQLILNDIVGITNWAFNFHRLLVHNDIIRTHINQVSNSLTKSVFLEMEYFDKIMEFGNALNKTLEDETFFYSMPIKSDKTSIKANDYISGKRGYQTKFFSDKFRINVSPEAERAVIPLKFYTQVNAETSEQSTSVEADPKMLAMLEKIPGFTPLMSMVSPLNPAPLSLLITTWNNLANRSQNVDNMSLSDLIIATGAIVVDPNTGIFSEAALSDFMDPTGAFATNTAFKQLVSNLYVDMMGSPESNVMNRFLGMYSDASSLGEIISLLMVDNKAFVDTLIGQWQQYSEPNNESLEQLFLGLGMKSDADTGNYTISQLRSFLNASGSLSNNTRFIELTNELHARINTFKAPPAKIDIMQHFSKYSDFATILELAKNTNPQAKQILEDTLNRLAEGRAENKIGDITLNEVFLNTTGIIDKKGNYSMYSIVEFLENGSSIDDDNFIDIAEELYNQVKNDCSL